MNDDFDNQTEKALKKMNQLKRKQQLLKRKISKKKIKSTL